MEISFAVGGLGILLEGLETRLEIRKVFKSLMKKTRKKENYPNLMNFIMKVDVSIIINFFRTLNS